MKSPLAIAIAASVLLSGCSIFQKSPTWEGVVASRAEYSGAMDAKDGYLNHLHQVLQGAGVAHKLVTYQFHFHNAYREEGVQTASAILYRDESTPRNPWWVMDEFHHIPVWLPTWELDKQIEFFTQRPVEIVSVKEYGGSSAPQSRDAKMERAPHHMAAHTEQERKFRALFVGDRARAKAPKPVKAPAAPVDPLTTSSLSGRSASSGNASAESLFRSTHGTQFDPGSSVDRAKMNELRRQLLNRTQRVSLRTQ